MADRDPLFDLPDLAAYAEDHTTPPPPENIRARGAQRRHRRHVGAVAATVAAVLIGGGAVFSQTGLLGDQSVDPAPQPSVTAVPSVPGVSQGLSAANLPTSFDLELNYPKEWLVGDTTSGPGTNPPSRCLGGDPSTLGATTIVTRSYSLAESTMENSANAVALEFADDASAATAYQTLQEWVDDCPAVLKEAGHARADLSIPRTPVEVDGGEAEHALVTADVIDETNSENTLFESIGVTLVDRRVELVSMVVAFPDFNYATTEDDPTELSTFPMMRSLPKVAARLAGSPIAEPAPKKLTDDLLLSAKDVPVAQNAESVELTADGEGRSVDALSACQKESLTSLGATQVASRNFRFAGGFRPETGDPDLYTATLQFENAGQSNSAERIVAGWMNDCRATLRAKDYTVGQPTGDTITSVPVETDVMMGDLYNVIYLEPGAPQEEGYFENVGTLVVGDRLVIMVRVHQGSEDYGYYDDPEEPVDGMQPHPFLAMMKRAATLLS